MHMVIRAIVYAKNKEDALAKAANVFDGLTENQDPFDYYEMFNTAGSVVSGRGRWGALPAAVKADSKAGKKLIEEGMKSTWDEFKEAIKAVREGISTGTDEKLFEDKDVKTNNMTGMFKYFCGLIGQYSGSAIWLYDHDGEGIRDREHLANTLSKWKCVYEDKGQENPCKDLSVWVVPADVHY